VACVSRKGNQLFSVNYPAAFAGIEWECYAGDAVSLEGVFGLRQVTKSSVECGDPGSLQIENRQENSSERANFERNYQHTAQRLYQMHVPVEVGMCPWSLFQQ